MTIYDENFDRFATESRASLGAEREAELSRRFKESMQGQELTGIDLGDYDTPVLANLDYAQGTLSPQYMKPFRQAIGTRDAATGENLLGPMTVEPEEPGRWSKAKKYIAGQVESILGMYGEGALQTLGAIDDIRNHVLDTSADLVVAMGGDEEDVVRGKQNIPQSDSLMFSIPRDLMSFAGKYAVARGALLKTVGKPVSLWGKFGLESAAGAVADFMQDPRTDSLIDAVSSIMGEERYIAELYKESPLTARAALAGEGSVIGAVAEGAMRGIPAAVQRLATYADDLEQIGVDRMRRSRSTLNSGIDPEGLRGLVEYFTGKILKGANDLTEDLRAEVMAAGATDDQVAGAFRQAMEVVQQGEDRAIASPIRPSQPAELGFSEIFGGEGAARAAGEGAAYPLESRDLWWGDANYEQTGGELIYMTPDEFLAQARPMDYTDEVTLENVNDLVDHVKSGRKLDPLALYSNGKEDGRHRALMAKQLGIESVPVLTWRGAEQPRVAAPVTGNTSPIRPGQSTELGFTEIFGDTKAAMEPEGVDVWHGSPHKYDQPSLSAVGSGEGAQAYGHGYYSAESQQVGVSYRDQLTRTTPGSVYINGQLVEKPSAAQSLAVGAQNWGGDPLTNLDKITPTKIYTPEVIEEAKRLVESGSVRYEKAGYLYKLRIPKSDVDNYLDWDKPLAAQSPEVRRALLDYGNKDHKNVTDARGWFEETGSNIYHDIVRDMDGNKSAAADALSELGIPGIKYLDQSSRAAGEGTRNFVTFDPDRIQVISRNGKELRKNEKKRNEVLAALGAAGAMMQVYDDSEQVQ